MYLIFLKLYPNPTPPPSPGGYVLSKPLFLKPAEIILDLAEFLGKVCRYILRGLGGFRAAQKREKLELKFFIYLMRGYHPAMFLGEVGDGLSFHSDDGANPPMPNKHPKPLSPAVGSCACWHFMLLINLLFCRLQFSQLLLKLRYLSNNARIVLLIKVFQAFLLFLEAFNAMLGYGDKFKVFHKFLNVVMPNGMFGTRSLVQRQSLSFEVLFDRLALRMQARNGEIFPALRSSVDSVNSAPSPARGGEGGAVSQPVRLGRAGADFGGFPVRGPENPIIRGNRESLARTGLLLALKSHVAFLQTFWRGRNLIQCRRCCVVK
jgi:hypothetical protein